MNGAPTRAYSLSRNGNAKLSQNFTVREFACKDGSDPVLISEALVSVLQQIRSHFGKPVTINSGYRTVTHNQREGGTAQSQHLYGLAADIVVQGVKPSEVADYAEKLLFGTGGIGRYAGFTHIDVRKSRSRWNG